ncbi:MAG: histone deacetylase family protein [Alphaproteobacteria bacterium]
MTSFCYHHDACIAHNPGPKHSERAERLTAIVAALRAAALPGLVWREAPLGTRAAIERAHGRDYVDFVFNAMPEQGQRAIEVNDVVSDDDGGEVTTLSKESAAALLHCAGMVTAAVDAVASGQARNALCLTRPPGHHALADKAMGFCVFNHAAVAARYAQQVHGYRRIAIVDFDVHHGNGTQQIFKADPSVFFASIHQLPLWPETGHAHETGVGNILNVPCAPDLPRGQWLELWRDRILSRLERETFDFLVISSGFDAHRADPKGKQNLETADYTTITRDLCAIAASHCAGRVVSVLEGGYDIAASAASAVAHAEALCVA